MMTEFPYDTAPQPRYFPQRNRIISGLSKGVLVVEAGYRSGALITARYAAEQGRDVFVVPGPVFSPQSHGCHRLIKEGAKLVERSEDILQEYELPHPPLSQRTLPSDQMDERVEGWSSEEKKVFELLGAVPLSVDELVELSHLPVDHLAGVLLSLEIKGRIQALPGQNYVTYNK
jgi:DNA processing protein